MLGVARSSSGGGAAAGTDDVDADGGVGGVPSAEVAMSAPSSAPSSGGVEGIRRDKGRRRTERGSVRGCADF